MIGADEVASHIDAMTMQAFNVKMKKDSSDEESDGDDTDPDYVGDKRVSVLSNEEDEEGRQTAQGNVVTPVTTEGDDAQTTQTLNQGEAISDDTAETQQDKGIDDDDKNLEMAPFCMVLQSLQQEESAKVHQTMCPSE